MNIVTTLLLATGAILIVTIALLLRDAYVDVRKWFLPTLVAGIASSLLAVVAYEAGAPRERLVALAALAVAAVWIRWKRIDSDSIEGIVTGAIIGAIIGGLTVSLQQKPEHFLPAVTLLGAIAGLFAHIVVVRSRRAALLLAVAVGAAIYVIDLLARESVSNLRSKHVLAVASGVAVSALISAAVRLSMLRRELGEEVELGFMPPEEVESIAHPFRRLTRAKWADRDARREYVRLATDLAVRKLRQRRMDPATARLYQLEILQLRGAVQEVYAVEMSMRNIRSDDSYASERTV